MFFATLQALHQFTLNLAFQAASLLCQKCLTSGQFVSHGFIYKKQTNQEPQAVGKRIFCSNRNGRSGCGTTLRLYPAERIPGLQYSTSQLERFLTSLISGASIRQAYTDATQTVDARNAFRWLKRLHAQLTEYRRYLDRPTEALCDRFALRPRRLQVLLPTIQQLFSMSDTHPCTHYQLTRQIAFV